MPEFIILADIGNSRIKLSMASKSLPPINERSPIQIDLPDSPHRWFVCSVSPSETKRLVSWIDDKRPNDTVHIITHDDVLVKIAVDTPSQVGLDRLMAATAANEIAQDRDAVVIDAGTAVTVDAISNGKFLGGAIFPGSQTEFESLRTNAEQLPLVAEYQLPNSAIGKSTLEAIQAGVLLGQVGSIKYIADLIASELRTSLVITTGGGLKPIASRLPSDWKYVDDLVLEGIRITANRMIILQQGK